MYLALGFIVFITYTCLLILKLIREKTLDVAVILVLVFVGITLGRVIL